MATMEAVRKPGYMPMPAGFKYKELFLQGRPRHEKFDAFWRDHPPMDSVHRAKIFAPFDALAGFDEAIGSKLVPYEGRKALSEDEKEKLDQILNHLHTLTQNGKTARQNCPWIAVTYFVPCTDEHNEWYGKGGQYVTVTGICQKVDVVFQTIILDGRRIAFSDVIAIR